MSDNRAAMVTTADLPVKADTLDAVGVSGSRDWVMQIARAAASVSPDDSLARYLAALEWALRDEPPPFGTATYAEMYRRAASDPQWMALSLIRQAERAGDAARRLWSLADAATEREAEILQRHAVRQSDHVRTRLELVDLTFPGVVGAELRASLDELCPGFVMMGRCSSAEAASASTNDLLDVNQRGIRAAALQLMERIAVRAHVPGDSGTPAGAVADRLADDALTLVCDTAKLVDDRVRQLDDGEVRSLMAASLRRTIRHTSEEPIDFTYHSRFGTYP